MPRPPCGTADRLAAQRRLPVEGDVADRDLGARLRAPSLASCVLDPEPGQPVGEVADRLVVGEVGLQHPAPRLRRRGRRTPARPIASTVKPLSRGRRRAQHDPGRLDASAWPRAACRPTPPSRSRARAARAWRRRRDLEDREARTAPRGRRGPARRARGRRARRSCSARRAAGRSASPPSTASSYAASSASIWLQVADRVAAGLERRAVEDVHQHRAALDVAQELQAEALALLAPGIRPGTSATVNTVSPASTTPRFGTSVVNG